MRLIAISGLLLMLCGNSLAADFFVGADLGVTRTRLLNDSRGSIGLYVGATLNDRFATEVGWRRVGQSPRADIASASVLARSSWSSNWSLYGRAGLARLSSDGPNGVDAGRTRLLWGGGFHGALGNKLAMRVDLQITGSSTRHLGAGLMWRL